MSVQKFEESKCRICWTGNEELDWNNPIFNHDDLTYKDCFYKYTQLVCIDEDGFSSMICHNCSKGLEYIDDFISMAIETNAKLQEMRIFDGMNNKEEIIALTTDNESMYLEDIEIKQEDPTSIFYETVEGYNISQNISPQTRIKQRVKDTGNPKTNNTNTHQSNNLLLDKLCMSGNEEEDETPKRVLINERILEETVDTTKCILLVRQLRKYYTGSSSRRHIKRDKKKSFNNRSNKSYDTKLDHLKTNESDIAKFKQPSQICSNEMSEEAVVEKTKDNKTRDNIFLCQYCSAEFRGWSNLLAHEAKHTQVRKRTETCPQCGVKFYNKRSLRFHQVIHDSNREKRFKCEFCEKAFYNMGALNIHKRIHLGLMVKCQICSKEFFRNVELYKHMNSHSSKLINVDVKKRSRYFVRCKYCNKKMLSTSFKSHTAVHLNQPLLKCSICNKEYFNRESCRHHIRTIHQKKPETVNNYIVLLKTDRLTHLYIKQNADIEPDEN